MERWNNKHADYRENPAVDRFLEEVVEVCRKHGMSIGHEDGHGAFQVEPLEESSLSWLMSASDLTGGD